MTGPSDIRESEIPEQPAIALDLATIFDTFD